MRTRLKDVAERVKLSPALVSGVLNDKANVWASAETRARVHVAARELNYHPSTAARALSHGKTKVVALVYRRLEGTGYRLAYTGLVDAFSAVLQERGYSLMVSNFATEEEVLDHLSRLSNAHACDAVILWGREADTGPQGALLESLGMPFLVKGRHEATHPGWRQVDFDHEWMMGQAFARLVAAGHRCLAYLGFPHEDAYVGALRAGFGAAHLHHLGEPPRLLAACGDDLAANVAAIEPWLDLPVEARPTGFVIGAGNYAWHALEACLARRGLALGQGSDAAGLASYGFTLAFGQAFAYQDIEIDKLALEVSPAMLDAMLGDEAGERVVRFRPALMAAPSVGLPLVHRPHGLAPLEEEKP